MYLKLMISAGSEHGRIKAIWVQLWAPQTSCWAKGKKKLLFLSYKISHRLRGIALMGSKWHEKSMDPEDRTDIGASRGHELHNDMATKHRLPPEREPCSWLWATVSAAVLLHVLVKLCVVLKDVGWLGVTSWSIVWDWTDSKMTG